MTRKLSIKFHRGAPAPAVPLWRVLHDAELPDSLRPVRNWPTDGVPEVYWGNREQTPFGKSWQLLSYAMNPGMDPLRWRILYEYDTAFCNGTGFNEPGSPRADYVNGRDLAAKDPMWQSLLFCGGATPTGQVDGADLIIDHLDGFGPAPTLEWIMARPQYFFEALIVYQDGHLSKFPYNDGRPVLVPLVGSGVARYPLSKLVRVGT